MKLLDSQVDPRLWNLASKCNFLHFWPPEKSVFELMTSLKFSFSESGPGSVHIPVKAIFLFNFSNFQGHPENAPNHILSSNSAGKILKMAINSKLLGLCSWKFWNFLFSMRLSNGEYFKDFKIFDLTWIWWIWLEWPLCQNVCILDKRFRASIIVPYKFKCRPSLYKRNAKILLWKITLLSSCF